MVKKLGFGLMRLPLKNKDDQKSVNMDLLCEMVDTFLERGFTYFDTAYMYHDFESEKFLKDAVVKRYPRDAFTVATKMPVMFLEKREDLERIFNEQLEKCGVDYFDYYLLHNLNVSHYEIAKKMDSFAFIQRKKQEGKIKNIGFSYHDDARLFDEILTAHPEVDFVQLQVNYLDWDNASIQSGKCCQVAKKHGKPVIVMEPVKGGTLANVPKPVEDILKRVRPELSIPSWAIRFAASVDNVMMVLSGMSSLEQLEDNSNFMQNFQPLNEQEYEAIKQAVEKMNASIAIPCTGCQYCTAGCPKNIAIPQYFALYNAEKQDSHKGFSTQQVYYNNYTKTYGKASDCIGCKKCEKACPQHLAIADFMKQVSAVFE